jgi:asparagine N-glycosylation enzyme membrane subunit Stt3
LEISLLASALPPRLHTCPNEKKYEVNVLWTIFVVLLLLWLLGIATSYTLGGLIHILLVLAVVTVLIRVIQGRRIVS